MSGENRLSSLNLFFLWFGAAISVAEILTGGLLADLGLGTGITSIVLGHLVGTVFLVMAGFIGFKLGEPAIRSFRLSFGRQGSWLLSAVNIIQLIGWTAVMVIEGGRAVNILAGSLWGVDSQPLACGLTGLAVALWVGFGVKNVARINTIAVSLLLILTVVLSWVLLGQGQSSATPVWSGSFALGFELSIIMPLSWFPLIADYTSMARSGKSSWLAPFAGYFAGSTWMYLIGFLGASRLGNPDPSGMMLAAGLGLVAIIIIGLSTVTTTFLDVHSAAESLGNIMSRIDRRLAGIFFAAAGTLLAIYFPIEQYIDFLLLLGSVFAPLIAIVLLDFFVFRFDARKRILDPAACVVLALGVAFYHLMSGQDLPTGTTLATIVATGMLHALVRTFFRRR